MLTRQGYMKIRQCMKTYPSTRRRCVVLIKSKISKILSSEEISKRKVANQRATSKAQTNVLLRLGSSKVVTHFLHIYPVIWQCC